MLILPERAYSAANSERVVTPRTGGKTAVFVDRDGVIIVNRSDYVRNAQEAEIIPGALEALAAVTQAGHPVFVVTNQSAVGRGLLSIEELQRIHSKIVKALASRGGTIDAFMVCPHRPEAGCSCRKPKPGLLLQVRDRFGIELRSAFLVGDSEVDMEAATAAGCSGVLVMTGVTPRNGIVQRDEPVVENLGAAWSLIKSIFEGRRTPIVRLPYDDGAASVAQLVARGCPSA